MRRLVVILAVLLTSVLTPVLSTPAQAAGCQFQLGFKSLHDLIPDIVGICQDDESHSPTNGDALQHTTKGLLVWRKADNWTAFTDGYHTWVNGPDGLQERLNSQRFIWEANPDHLSTVGSANGQAQGVAGPVHPLASATSCSFASTDSLGPEEVVAVLFQKTVPWDLCTLSPTHGPSSPMTSRLKNAVSAGPGDYDPICRCQNSPNSITVSTELTQAGAIVHAVLQWQDSGAYRFDVTVLRTPSGWLADDVTCTGGGSSTSIYLIYNNPSLPSCR